jgi:hypothetical protein
VSGFMAVSVALPRLVRFEFVCELAVL